MRGGEQNNKGVPSWVVEHLVSMLRVMAKGLERTSDGGDQLGPPAYVTQVTGRVAAVESKK